MKTVINCLIFVMLLIACNNSSDSAATKTDTVAKEDNTKQSDTLQVAGPDNARTSLDWAGTYKGVVPCADCEGIETEIELKADSSYKLTTTYLGKKNNPKHTESGKWNWVDGAVIRLEGIKDGPSKYFVAEGKLIQLDLEGKKIEGALADKYVLAKVK